MFGPVTREENRSLQDLSLREWTTLVPLLFAIVAIGFYPSPLLDAVKSPVEQFVARVNGSGSLPQRPFAQNTGSHEVRPAELPAGAPGNVVRPFFPNRAPLAVPAQPSNP